MQPWVAALGVCAACSATGASAPDPVPAAVLMAAPLPAPFSGAVHTWLVVGGAAAPERWEVWQTAEPGDGRWGHVARDYLPPFAGVGGGPAFSLATLDGPAGEAFAACLRERAPTYRWRETYVVVPGPNSNTFTAAMLDACGWSVGLPWSAVGARFPAGRSVRLEFLQGE